MKKPFNHILKTVGIIIFIYIMSIIDFPRMKIIIAEIKIYYLILAIIFSLILVMVKTMRWQYINHILHFNVPFFSAVKISIIASALGMITPGRLGELIKVRSIKRYTPDLTKRWSGILIDRIHDVIVLLFTGLVAVFFITQIELNSSYSYFFLFILSILIFLFINKYWEVCLFWFIGRILNQGEYLSVKEKVKDVFNNFSKTFKASFLNSFCYSVVSYFIQCIITLMIVFSMGVNIPFHVIFIVISVSAFASLLPITVGGLGTREGIYIYLFSQHGISIETSLAIAFIDGILIFTFFIGMLAFIFWVTNGFSIEF